jgi:hypothetical protein
MWRVLAFYHSVVAVDILLGPKPPHWFTRTQSLGKHSAAEIVRATPQEQEYQLLQVPGIKRLKGVIHKHTKRVVR